MARFESGTQHIMAELARIDAKVRLEVTRTRLRTGRPDADELQGLYISEADLDTILAKTRPGQILYPSAGTGTTPHLATELLASMAQVRMTHVAYKGAPPVIIDLVAGRVVMTMSSTFGITMPHVRSGRLRALAVSSATRIKALPEVPSIAETVPGYEDVQWAAFMAPAGTPPEILDRLHKEIVSILRLPETRERLAIDGAEVVGNTPEELAAFLKAEITKWMKVVKAVGIEPE